MQLTSTFVPPPARRLGASQDCASFRPAEAANDFETRSGKYLSYITNTIRAATAASSRKLNPIWMPMFRHGPGLRAALPLALSWIFTQVDDPLVVFLD